MMLPGWVGRRYIARRRRLLAAVVMVTFVMTSASLLISVARIQIGSALDDSISLSQGGARVAVSAPDARSASLLASNGFSPVLDHDGGSVSRESHTSETAIRELSSVGVPGRLVAGHAPHQLGDAAVSESVAKSLRIGPGDTVVVRAPGFSPRSARVTGTTVDPMAPDVRRVSVMVASVPRTGGTIWLGDRDPESIHALQPILERLEVTQIPLHFGDANASPILTVVNQLRAAVWGLAALTLAVCIVNFAVLRAGARSDETGLEASGMDSRVARRSLHAIWVSGCEVGVIAAVIIVSMAQIGLTGVVGRQFHQVWSGVKMPVSTVVTLLAIPVFAGLMSLVFGSRRAARSPRQRRLGGRAVAIVVGAVAGVAAVTLAYSGISVLLLHRSGGIPLTAAPALGVVVLFALPGMESRLLGAGAGPTSRWCLTAVTRRTRSTSLLVALALFAACSWMLAVDRTAVDNAGTNPISNVLQVVNVPQDRSMDLVGTYRSVGGGGRVNQYAMLVSAGNSQPLAVSASMGRCLERALRQQIDNSSCSDGSERTMVLSSQSDSSVETTTTALGTPAGAVAWTDDEGRTVRVMPFPRAGTPSVQADEASVVLVGAHSMLARKADLRPASSQFVILPNYFTLSTQAQATLRSYLYTELPTAFPQSDVDPGDAVMLHSLAEGVALVCTALAPLVLVMVGLAEVAASEETYTSMRAAAPSGAFPALRRCGWMPVAVTILAPTVAALCSWLALPHNGNGIGLLWLGPVAGLILGAVVVARLGCVGEATAQ